MRRTRDRLNTDPLAFDGVRDLASTIKTWAEAKRKDESERKLSDDEKMEMAARRVKDFVRRLQKEFGPALKRNGNTTAIALSDHLGPRFKDVAEEMWGHLSDSEQAEIVESIYGPEDEEPDTAEIIGEQPGEDVKPEPPRKPIIETLVPIEHPKG
jgi:hypothetical protein